MWFPPSRYFLFFSLFVLWRFPVEKRTDRYCAFFEWMDRHNISVWVIKKWNVWTDGWMAEHTEIERWLDASCMPYWCVQSLLLLRLVLLFPLFVLPRGYFTHLGAHTLTTSKKIQKGWKGASLIPHNIVYRKPINFYYFSHKDLPCGANADEAGWYDGVWHLASLLSATRNANNYWRLQLGIIVVCVLLKRLWSISRISAFSIVFWWTHTASF